MIIAEKITAIGTQLGIPLIFKASYRKANRTKANSLCGIDNEKSLKILKEVSKAFDVPVATDIHESH